MTKRFTTICLAALALSLYPGVAAAQLGGRPAEDWIVRLERPERVASLKTAEVIQKLDLKPGDVVADIGAGAGVFSWPLARAVAPGGTVYSVEIDPDFLAHIKQRAAEQRITNVRTVLGKFEDPQLPAKVDLAFFNDVLHHIEKRAEYLKAVASYLKPNGRIAVIELDATRPDATHKDQPELQVTKQQLRSWMTAAGLEQVQEIPMYEDKWFVIYARPSAGR